jgi:undecaprenyl-diphosphatase
MLSLLQELDTALFRLINISLANPLTDAVMPFLTNGEHWVLVACLAAGLLVRAHGLRSLPVLLGAALVFAICDQASAHLFKPWIDRVRPCHTVPDVHLLVGCSDSRSFPSAHATNSFGCALFMSWALPRWRWLYVGVALLVSSSRVFVGVHYPFDLLAGFVLGAAAAAAVAMLMAKLQLGLDSGTKARRSA